jgi:hypothetical protein
MLTVFARPFILLGEEIHEMRAMLILKKDRLLPDQARARSSHARDI